MKKAFLGGLVVFVLIYLGYGLHRFSLGLDFTDEGAHLAWPLRALFGETLFSSELVTLSRPIEVYLFIPFSLHPSMTLYEFRLAGWSLHLLSFAVLATYLFRRSGAALQSLLIASLPFFACHIFGEASPNYNSLTCDFLLLALSLRGLMVLPATGSRHLIGVLSGLMLFAATFSHPGLGLVGACFVLRECWTQNLLGNLRRGRLSAGNAGVAAFLLSWSAFALYFIASGTAARWAGRLALTGSFTANSLRDSPGRFLAGLAVHPFIHSPLALGFTAAGLALAVWLWWQRRSSIEATGLAGPLFAGLIAVSFVATFSFARHDLGTNIAQGGLLLLLVHGVVRPVRAGPEEDETGFLMLMSGLGAFLCATLTYYFNAERSWVSGILALPFAFAVGLTLVARPGSTRPLLGILQTGILLLAVASLAANHYVQIQRDAPPGALTAGFDLPKLRGIKSTEERVRVIQELSAYLQPRLTRGESLVVYDDAPMLYYILDARPAYGLTWAVRYNQSPATLQFLDRELEARPLPRYVIRTLVDVSNPAWSTAPRTNYDHYPLNETVTANYRLEHTIFPFEIWRLNPGGLPPANPAAH